ncbi:MAG: sugar ABC transporter permease [Ignavibacteria bacterium]|nr:sugar ABC transporter permease [Ignavibacteria bacterium]
MKAAVPYLFLLPALLFLALFALLPMGQIFYYSLLNYSAFGPSEFVGAGNFVRLVNDGNFWWTLANSFLLVLVTPVIMVVALSLALLVRREVRIGKPFRLLFFLPVITPIVIVGIIWRWIFAEEIGMLNYLLSLFSLPPVHWLTDYPTTTVSIMIVTLWRGAGYYMMVFLAGLAVIPREVEEASMIDGAGWLQQTVHITIPLLKPTLTLVFVVSSTAAIKMFTEVYTIIPGAPIANKTLVVYLYQQAFERFDFGYGSAIAVVLFLLTIAFSYANVRLMESR